MNAFLWVMLILFCLNAIARASWIKSGVFPPLTPGYAAVDLIADVAFAAWALWLLFGGAA